MTALIFTLVNAPSRVVRNLIGIRDFLVASIFIANWQKLILSAEKITEKRRLAVLILYPSADILTGYWTCLCFLFFTTSPPKQTPKHKQNSTYVFFLLLLFDATISLPKLLQITVSKVKLFSDLTLLWLRFVYVQAHSKTTRLCLLNGNICCITAFVERNDEDSLVSCGQNYISLAIQNTFF